MPTSPSSSSPASPASPLSAMARSALHDRQASAWWSAIHRGDVAKVRALLSSGTSPNLASKTHETALDRVVNATVLTPKLAARLVPVLIDAGALPFQAHKFNPAKPGLSLDTTPFGLAMKSNDATVARAMVDAIDWEQGQGQRMAASAMLLAIHHQPPLVTRLLERGVSPNLSVPGQRNAGPSSSSLLSSAVQHGSPEAVAALLDAGAQRSEQERSNNVSLYTLLVTPKIPTARREEGRQRHLAMIELLRQRGWRLEGPAVELIVGQVVRHRASPDLIPTLLDLGANLHGITSREALTALHLAVSNPGGYAYVEPLLNLGMDPAAQSASGMSVIDRLRKHLDSEPQAWPVLALLEGHALRTTMATVDAESVHASTGIGASLGRRRL